MIIIGRKIKEKYCIRDVKKIKNMKNIPHFTIQNKKEITLEEKAQYIKQYLYMTESPIGGNYTEEQIGKMIYLINNDWKKSGYHHYEWIENVYSEMYKKNSYNQYGKIK